MSAPVFLCFTSCSGHLCSHICSCKQLRQNERKHFQNTLSFHPCMFKQHISYRGLLTPHSLFYPRGAFFNATSQTIILTEKPNMQWSLGEVQSALITTDQYQNVCRGKTDDDESFAHQLKQTLPCVLITRQGFILHPHLYIYTYPLNITCNSQLKFYTYTTIIVQSVTVSFL